MRDGALYQGEFLVGLAEKRRGPGLSVMRMRLRRPGFSSDAPHF